MISILRLIMPTVSCRLVLQCFYLLAGSIRSKNVKNGVFLSRVDSSRCCCHKAPHLSNMAMVLLCLLVLLWNLLDSAGGGLAFWSVGYAFAYGGDGDAGGKTFVGNKGFFMQGDEIRFEYWFFQFAFACAVSCKVSIYMIFLNSPVYFSCILGYILQQSWLVLSRNGCKCEPICCIRYSWSGLCTRL